MARELNLGGCERDVAKIAMGLDRSRFEPHVGCFRPHGFRWDELKRKGVPVVEFPLRSLGAPSSWRAWTQMARYLRENDIRLVHAYDTPTVVYALPVVSMNRRIAVSSQLCYRSLVGARNMHLLRITDQMVDRVVVNCRAMERHLIEDEHVSPSRIYLCHNGVDTVEFRPLPGPRPERLREASLVIGTICVLRPEKDLPTLIEAFARVRHLKAGLKLILVGWGSVQPELEALSARLGLGEDCLFEPATSNVPFWMRGIDIFVLPSISEAFSNSLLEAMACGCCPVGSRVGGTPELIEHGRRGLLFEPGNVADLANQLAFAIEQEPRRKAMAAEAARFAREQLSIEVAVGRMENLYGSLIEAGGG